MAVKASGRSSGNVVQLARPTLRETIARWRPGPRCATDWSASCVAAPVP
jgi:hypothetical protein